MDNNIRETPKTRFAYLDNVRSLVIILVIAIHSAVTYSGDGGWYYIEGSPDKLSIFEIATFGLFQSFVQAWSMGALFFISAFLATKALARRGCLNFIKERIFRLGLPLLIYVFIISPFILFTLIDAGTGNTIIEKYINYLKSFMWVGSTGPLWFIEILLLFCLIYAVCKKCFSFKNTIHTFNTKNIILVIIITGIMAFLFRLKYPIGSSFYNLQFSYFSSYITLFVAGIVVGENDLFENITSEQNIKWFKLTLIAGPVIWAIIMLLGGAAEGHRYFAGGLYWQSIAYAFWEAFVAIGFSIGIIAFFRKHINTGNKCSRLIAENAFGIYFFHAPILIIVSLLLKHWIIYPLVKFVAVTIITFFACLIFSCLVRKIKPLGVVFK
jgi:surface polysaccharide O-acyltransferase-like enzyme